MDIRHAQQQNGLDPKPGHDDEKLRRGPAGEAQPNPDDPDPHAREQSARARDDEPKVGTVRPEDYLAKDRADSRPD